MIKSIKMVDCTPYHQIEINDCKKINFVFGANGSGKSTISSFLSGRQDQRFASSSVEWDGVLHESIYVYNAVPKYKEVFREMFYKSGHKAHYNMMMGIEDTAEIEQV